MKTLKVAVSQPRVANPAGREIVEYAIVKFPDTDNAMIIPGDRVSETCDNWPYYKQIAKIEVDRPVIMAGSFEEVEADIMQIIRSEAIDAGILEENECGALFISHI